MNQEIWLSVLRSLLIVVGTWAVSKGWLDEANWQIVVGSIIAVAPIVWGAVNKTKTNIVKTAAALPEVAKVEVTPTKEGIELANNVGSTPTATVSIGGKV